MRLGYYVQETEIEAGQPCTLPLLDGHYWFSDGGDWVPGQRFTDDDGNVTWFYVDDPFAYLRWTYAAMPSDMADIKETFMQELERILGDDV